MVKNILFITLSNIGDAILATPVLQAINKIYPDAKVDIVSDERSKIIYEYCPYRGNIFCKDKKKFLRGVPGIIGVLRRNSYDLIIDLRTDCLTWLLKGRMKLTKKKHLDNTHAVLQHLSVIDQINTENHQPATKIWLHEKHEKFADTILQPGSDRTLILGPGCHTPVKIWPPKKFAELSNNLLNIFDRVVLLGAKNETRYSQEASNVIAIPCQDLTGKTDILQAAALLKRAKLYIGNDTGLGHIASAVGTPTVTIFGVGRPERYRPWGKTSVWLQGKDQEIDNVTVKDVLELIRQQPWFV